MENMDTVQISAEASTETNASAQMVNQTESFDSAYPVGVSFVYPEKSSRLLALSTLLLFIPKLILLIPHFVALYFVQIIAFLAGLLAQFAVLFTGKYPKSLYGFVSGSLRWQTRINAYSFGLADKYPPFRLGE